MGLRRSNNPKAPECPQCKGFGDLVDGTQCPLCQVPGQAPAQAQAQAQAHATVLDEAKTVVFGARQAAYGPPEDCFAHIATMWQAYLTGRPDPQAPVTAADVTMMMVLLKVVRQANQAKRDNLVDLAGYAACAERCT